MNRLAKFQVKIIAQSTKFDCISQHVILSKEISITLLLEYLKVCNLKESTESLHYSWRRNSTCIWIITPPAINALLQYIDHDNHFKATRISIKASPVKNTIPAAKSIQV
ncbi:MAG TPA: hypothetical protein PLD84_01440 [Chitinophagales bacterium]|nr:hypothetical protein [Chitinophagales bacterium]